MKLYHLFWIKYHERCGHRNYILMEHSKSLREYFELKDLCAKHRHRIQHHANMIEYPNRFLQAIWMIFLLIFLTIWCMWLILNIAP